MQHSAHETQSRGTPHRTDVDKDELEGGEPVTALKTPLEYPSFVRCGRVGVHLAAIHAPRRRTSASIKDDKAHTYGSGRRMLLTGYRELRHDMPAKGRDLIHV